MRVAWQEAFPCLTLGVQEKNLIGAGLDGFDLGQILGRGKFEETFPSEDREGTVMLQRGGMGLGHSDVFHVRQSFWGWRGPLRCAESGAQRGVRHLAQIAIPKNERPPISGECDAVLLADLGIHDERFIEGCGQRLRPFGEAQLAVTTDENMAGDDAPANLGDPGEVRIPHEGNALAGRSQNHPPADSTADIHQVRELRHLREIRRSATGGKACGAEATARQSRNQRCFRRWPCRRLFCFRWQPHELRALEPSARAPIRFETPVARGLNLIIL